MERRKFVIGLGALASGSATAVGTGAFSSASMDREANIDVVTDSNGLVALQSDTESDVVRETDAGQLTIDFTADGEAGGVNAESRYQIGYFGEKYDWMAPDEALGTDQDDPYAEPAFSILNQDSEPHSVTLEYGFDEDPGDSRLFLMAASRSADTENSDSNIPTSSQWYSASEGGELVFAEDGDPQGDSRLSSGGRIGVSVLVDARGGSTTDDLSGTLTVSSE